MHTTPGAEEEPARSLRRPLSLQKTQRSVVSWDQVKKVSCDRKEERGLVSCHMCWWTREAEDRELTTRTSNTGSVLPLAEPVHEEVG